MEVDSGTEIVFTIKIAVVAPAGTVTVFGTLATVDDKDARVACRLKKISEVPGVSSVQAMLRLPAESMATTGAVALPKSLEMFWGKEKVAPSSLERLKKTWALPEALLCQTTLMLPLESTISCSPGATAVLP